MYKKDLYVNYIYIYIYIYYIYIYIYILYIYIYIYSSVLVNEMPKSARYHIDRANSIVFYLKKVATTACFIREESSGAT